MATCYLSHQMISLHPIVIGVNLLVANFDVAGNRKIKQYSKPTKFPEHFIRSLQIRTLIKVSC